MTVIDEGLIAYLKTVSGTTDLVSTRIYGVYIPQAATLPCIVSQRVSTPRIVTMDTSGATGDLISPRFQVDAWAETQSSSKAITEAIRAALNGHTGATGGVTIRASLANEEAPSYDPETKLYRTRSEYIIWLEEA